MLTKAWDYIKANKMIEKGDRIVIGVSGGADSVCLLYVLAEGCREYNLALNVVHINHGIRGKEAVEDELFVKELCNVLNVDFYSFSYDVRKIAKEESISEEEAGRKVRYKAFSEICHTKQCNKIAIAHNKNDNAETVLFHLFRGTGMKGLSGIEPKRMETTDFGEVTIIRPLLDCSRMEIEEVLRKKEITYRTDSTNLTDDYSRNKIRNKILAYAVKEINSGAVENIAGAATYLREAKDYIEADIIKYYQELVEEKDHTFQFSISEMKNRHPAIQKGIIFQIMENLAKRRKDLEAKHVEAVLSLFDKQVGRCVHLPYGMIAERGYQQIKLYHIDRLTCENSDSFKEIPIIIPGKTIVTQKCKIIETERMNYKNNLPIPKSSCVKWFDYDKIENAVVIRTRKEGDYIQINRSGGSKKLKDYFIDHKVPRKLRDSLLLIADGSHIMWIIGDENRMSERYKVDEDTTEVLLIKMFDLEDSVDDR